MNFIWLQVFNSFHNYTVTICYSYSTIICLKEWGERLSYRIENKLLILVFRALSRLNRMYLTLVRTWRPVRSLLHPRQARHFSIPAFPLRLTPPLIWQSNVFTFPSNPTHSSSQPENLAPSESALSILCLLIYLILKATIPDYQLSITDKKLKQRKVK